MGILAEEEKNQLKSIYYDLKNPASYSTVAKLYEAVDRKIDKNKILTWLRGELCYTLHKPRRINFKRNHYEVFSMNHMWQSDLCDFPSLCEENDGYKYVLITIDCFSRFVWTRALKSKTSKEVQSALKSIITSNDVPPTVLITDRGGEYFSKPMATFFKKLGIKHYAPSSDTFKAALAERAVKTFKAILFKVLTASYSLRYIDVLDSVTETMNSRYHRSINMAPKDVSYQNQEVVAKYIVKSRENELVKPQKMVLRVGDFVRIALNKNTAAMDKAHTPNWSDEVYEVIKIIATKKHPLYQIRDYELQTIDGNFYAQELQKVEKNEETVYRIEEIVKTRMKRGVKEFFVKWKNFNSKHNSWVRESDIVGSL